MRCDKFLFLISIFLAGCLPATSEPAPPVIVTPPPTPSPSATSPQIDDELKQLANDFTTLRTLSGHFNGGTWNDDVDQWMGRKHTLMLELGTRLGTGDYDRSTLTDLLGPPDHITKGGDSLLELILTLPAYQTAVADEYLVYEWRSVHDFLFFMVQDGRITAADWWYAGE